jgi:hypothetical protein
VDRRLIPFGERRRREMAKYSFRHYSKRQWRLGRPSLIVEHFAEASSIGAIYNTFAPDRPDPTYGELPNVCSHFAVSRSGRVVQLVGLRARCRHVVGLNHVSIGIEHVGYSNADVMGSRRELRASLRLTHALRCRFRIPIRNVIGHAESLLPRTPQARLYREDVKWMRGDTHGDFPRRTMREYRRKLATMGRCTRANPAEADSAKADPARTDYVRFTAARGR